MQTFSNLQTVSIKADDRKEIQNEPILAKVLEIASGVLCAFLGSSSQKKQ